MRVFWMQVLPAAAKLLLLTILSRGDFQQDHSAKYHGTPHIYLPGLIQCPRPNITLSGSSQFLFLTNTLRFYDQSPLSLNLWKHIHEKVFFLLLSMLKSCVTWSRKVFFFSCECFVIST